jgi:hypothetical protein
MKDSEFIELLNLYLDHEISVADAARLEAEVLGNPARRRIYQDYCRMQKACKLLAKDFATEVPADGKVVAFESAQPARRAGWYIAGGFAAAAACVAFILVDGRQSQSIPSAQPAVAVSAPASSTERSSIGRAVSMPTPRDEPQAVLVNALVLTGQSNAKPSPLFISQEAQPAPQFVWLHDMQLPPVQRASLEQLRFDGSPKLRPENRPYDASRAPLRGADEMSAFKFQK